jgi:hypothetical protein
MHGCSDERGNGRMRLYICTPEFAHQVFGGNVDRGLDHWLRYTPAFEVSSNHSIFRVRLAF